MYGDGIWEWRILFVLFTSIALNYLFGILIIKNRSKKWLLLAVILSLGTLFYYKYFNFFKTITGLGTFYDIALLLGISFFTFTQISFLVDCYKGKVKVVVLRLLYSEE